MTNTRDIALLLSQQRTTKQDAVPIYKGEIVEMRNGAGDDSIYVDNRPLHIWVRLWSAQGSVVPVYNERVASVAGLPVLVSRRPGTVHELEVIGLDVETLQSQDDPNTGLVNPFHAAAHEWPDAGPGIDPLTVYPRSWSQLKTYPQNPLSTSVDVSPLRHQTASTITIFNGGTEALAADIAALGANEAQLVLIYLDTTTNALASANGAVGTIADGWTLAEPTIPTNDAYLSAVVRIYNGQTEIDEFDIRDRRFFLNPVPGTISNVHWCNVWVVADCGGDFTTVVDAVADARVVNGDTLLIMPDTYAGWATSKTLSYAALTPYNQADHSGDVIINTGVIINNNPGGTQTFYGIEFQATVRLDYDQNAYFLSCGLEGSDAIESGVNSTGAGLTVLDHCYVGDAIVATAGSGWDLELHDTDVDGAITLDQDLILWSHVQVAGAMTITGSITRVDAPHIEHAAWGINTLVVAQEGAEYTTVAAAVAALGANETAIITVDTWTCDNQTLAANENMVGVDKDQCILSTTTVTRCINLGSSGAEPYLANITVSNTYDNAAAITAVHITEDCELRDVYARADNANGGAAAHAYGYEIDNTGTYNVKMVDCEAYATKSGGAPPNGYGIYIAAAGAAGPTIEIHGGRYEGDDADIYADTNSTVKLFGPVLVNTTDLTEILGAGTVEGWWYDVDGLMHTANIPLTAGDEDSTERVYSITRTVGAGKDHATIQAAIDWFKHGKVIYGDCVIDVDAGSYDEAVVFDDIVLAANSTLTLEGDARVLAGLSYVHAALMNQAALANGGSGTCGLATNPARDQITVTGTVANPDFNADGWGNGDEILVLADNWTQYERTINSISPGGAGNHVIELTVALPAGATLGTLSGAAIGLKPDRQIERSAAGPCIDIDSINGIIVDGWYLETGSGAACIAIRLLDQAQARFNNVLTYAEDYSAQINNGSIIIANTGAISFWGSNLGAVGQNNALLNISYSTIVDPTSHGYYALTFCSIIASYAVATRCNNGYRASDHSWVDVDHASALRNTTGYFSGTGSAMDAILTNAQNDNNGANYSPAVSDVLGNSNGFITWS
jgi:hypothetical protein